nr:hypothetical protein [uncultured Acinetobacter sp.]
MQNGYCLFCQENKNLKRSHAIGNTIFSSLLKKCEKNAAIKISTYDEKLSLSNDSWATKQLCGDCEQFFNEKFEAYSINALRGKVASVNIINLINGISYSNIDTDKLSKYFLSIYWRGAHSSHQGYNNLKITREIDMHIRSVLKGESKLSKNINIKLSSLYDGDGRIDSDGIKDIIISPFTNRHNGKLASYDFIFEGLLVQIFFGKVGYFEKRKNGYIDESKRIIVLPQKNIFDIKAVVDTFEYGKYLKGNE